MKRVSTQWPSPLGRARTLRLAGVALATLLGASATGEVTLTNSVQKLESYVDAAGVVQQRLVEVVGVEPGDQLRYTITFLNAGNVAVDAGSIVITNPLPENTEYLQGTASGPNTVVLYSVDGEHFAPDDALTVTAGGRTGIAEASDYRAIRWTFDPVLEPGESSFVTFDVRLK